MWSTQVFPWAGIIRTKSPWPPSRVIDIGSRDESPRNVAPEHTFLHNMLVVQVDEAEGAFLLFFFPQEYVESRHKGVN